jgi:hypothetical protein
MPKTTITARVPAELASDLARMAEAGNRTVSREIWAACAEHVTAMRAGGVSSSSSSSDGGAPPPFAEGA